jgi:hypothetical protein
MKATTFETLIQDQKERIANCNESNNEIINFINDINYELKSNHS